jgi:hypothetical protein
MPTMDEEMLVWERRGLSRVKYTVEMAKRVVLHELEEYIYHRL